MEDIDLHDFKIAGVLKVALEVPRWIATIRAGHGIDRVAMRLHVRVAEPECDVGVLRKHIPSSVAGSHLAPTGFRVPATPDFEHDAGEGRATSAGDWVLIDRGHDLVVFV